MTAKIMILPSKTIRGSPKIRYITTILEFADLTVKIMTPSDLRADPADCYRQQLRP